MSEIDRISKETGVDEAIVRKVVKAMREPTQDMAAVGKHALETSARGARQLTDMGHSVMTFPHLAAWRAMIDEILSDKSN